MVHLDNVSVLNLNLLFDTLYFHSNVKGTESKATSNKNTKLEENIYAIFLMLIMYVLL